MSGDGWAQGPTPTMDGPDGKLIAAVMAAVDAYLTEEARAAESGRRGRLSAWRAVARQSVDPQLWLGRSWTGRDRAVQV